MNFFQTALRCSICFHELFSTKFSIVLHLRANDLHADLQSNRSIPRGTEDKNTDSVPKLTGKHEVVLKFSQNKGKFFVVLSRFTFHQV